MAKKVFLSFLGLNKYEKTRYYLNEEKTIYFDTPFVQEAILKYLIEKEGYNVIPKIFITKEAYINWLENENNKGLNKCLIDINSNFTSADIEISSGKSEKELLDIFLKVFDELNEEDEIFFDITHGFRSLPMLAMVLLNYARFLKNIKIQGIYYGAFDASQIIAGVKWSPVWNLTYFSKIQSWASAANQFLQTGNGLTLSELIEDEGLSNLKTGIENFTKEILVNRGPSIFSGNTQLLIQEQISALDYGEKDPLKIILNKVKKHFDNYKNDSIVNGLNAVEWCIKNGLIQQGATLLEEFCTTYALVQVDKEEFLQNSDIRSFVSAAITISPDEYKSVYTSDGLNNIALEKKEKYQFLQLSEEEIIPKIHALVEYKKLKRLVNDLKTSVRNDINHAGFRESPRNYDEFKESLRKRYQEFLKIINK